MLDYLVAIRSARSPFSIGFAAENDDVAIEHVIGLIVKARAPTGAKVVIVQPDGTELDVSETVAPYFDRPEV